MNIVSWLLVCCIPPAVLLGYGLGLMRFGFREFDAHMRETQARIARARQEIAEGARPHKGRFRL